MFSLRSFLRRTSMFLGATAVLAACSANAASPPIEVAPAAVIPQTAAQRLQDAHAAGRSRGIEHVLLLSVDGMHAVDLLRFVAQYPQSALARLSQSGVTYANAKAPYPSDSFPGLLALVTGGHPKSTGVYYDDSFDRALFPPGSSCTGIPGTEVVYDESIDRNPKALDGGGGIDPATLPRDASCKPVYPHSFLRVNTVFEAVRATGRRTAWADKHRAYDLVNGPSGSGVDDLYTPEIASIAPNGGDYTKSFADIKTYDDIKVRAILNEIDGKTSTGGANVGVPAVFGMNFQAVSIGQKLKGGGYADASGTPSAPLADELAHTDASIARMLAELDRNDLPESTVVIVTAKHGQSPIDQTLIRRLDDGPYGTALAHNLGNGRYQTDDVALIWLQNQSATNVRGALANLAPQAQILGFDRGTVYSSETNLPDGFGMPGDGRTPDIAIEPNHGAIYTGGSKLAEHGGFADDDTHVALLVSSPRQHARTETENVETTQVAPTILRALGLDRRALRAVQMENTRDLPALTIYDRGSK
jgi:hypothetical protein